MSRDERLLELMADVNFYAVLVGIESFNASSLRETHKYQNLRADLVGDLRKIQSYGVGVRGSFIVGFDHDGPEIFDTLFQGVQQACIPWPTVGLLQAHQHTRLWRRLRSEGRVVYLKPRKRQAVPKIPMNIIPLGMSRAELIQGCHDLNSRLLEWEAACERIRGWAAGVRRLPQVNEALFQRATCERFLAESQQRWELTPKEYSAIRETLDETWRSFPLLINRVIFFLVRSRTSGSGSGGSTRTWKTGWRRSARGNSSRSGGRCWCPRASTELSRGFPRAVCPPSPAAAGQDADRGGRARGARGLRGRWGTAFQQVEPQHRQFLLELCDRSASRRGGSLELPPRTRWRHC